MIPRKLVHDLGFSLNMVAINFNILFLIAYLHAGVHHTSRSSFSLYCEIDSDRK